MAGSDQGKLQRLERKLAREQAARKEAEYLAEQKTAELYLTNQSLIEQSQKALAAAEAKSQFLATMSHEIRTPLNAIIGMSELLQEAELNAEQKDWVNIVNVSSQSLLSLINDILDFSKIESGHLEMESVAFDLRLCMEETLEILSVRAAEKDIELICNYPDRLPRFFMGDPVRTRQILLNLVGNAVKFTSEGEVRLECTGISENSSSRQCRIELNVTDTGIGIPADKQASIFNSFSQADSSTTREFGGTGLGLTISRRLCELMGGKMGVESSGIKGKGSKFYFDLHMAKADIEEQLPDLTRLKNVKALVVDDNKNNLKILKHRLEHWGVSVVEFLNPEKALELIQNGLEIDLAVLDMQMPAIDGVELAGHIKNSHPDCPILLLTSMGKVEQTQGRKLLYAQHSKPVRTDVLLAELLSMVRAGGQLNSPTADLEESILAESIPMNILLVDDNALNRTVGGKLLEKLGYQPDFAENGEKALEALRAKEYDLVLMDVQMPVMDGITASKLIQEQWPEASRPHIFALTADIQQSTKQALQNVGVEQVLSKPIQLQELSASFKKLAP